ncbi:hypothetical protein [Mycobacterium intracellulare]|uniref:hypothetical protein n=1 Tax=Mycobacterium intracellulare TaxID=1767 RepID=UPI000C7A5955|nr:hypothetical protein [Mycobacterium intracellulare]
MSLLHLLERHHILMPLMSAPTLLLLLRLAYLYRRSLRALIAVAVITAALTALLLAQPHLHRLGPIDPYPPIDVPHS